MKKINRYECPKCHQHITLYGGSTNGTSVVCENCNVWMHVGNPHSIKIIKDNTEMPGLQALEFVVPERTESPDMPDANISKGVSSNNASRGRVGGSLDNSSVQSDKESK